jgi:hypothetical protein
LVRLIDMAGDLLPEHILRPILDVFRGHRLITILQLYLLVQGLLGCRWDSDSFLRWFHSCAPRLAGCGPSSLLPLLHETFG